MNKVIVLFSLVMASLNVYGQTQEEVKKNLPGKSVSSYIESRGEKTPMTGKDEKIVTTFFENGTYETIEKGQTSTGTWVFDEKAKYLKITPQGKRKPKSSDKVVKLTATELMLENKLLSMKFTLVFLRQ